MRMFFSSLFELEQFTFSLNSQSSKQVCQYCSQNSHWVSHGFVYKQQSSRRRFVVGKRILCSKRYGRDGCGRTRQLYLQEVIPRRHYLLPTLLAFIETLLKGNTVKHAWQYTVAKPPREPRQAWRWLNALMRQLGRFRTLLNQPPSLSLTCQRYSSARLTILLPTLAALLQSFEDNNALQCQLKGALC
jgi:hypothetical protein